MPGITIGELARLASVNVETIRYYERRGLLRDPRASGNGHGYRRYPSEAVADLQFIKRARQLGFSLKEVEELLALRRSPEASRARVHALAAARLEELDRRIRELQRAHGELQILIGACGACSEDDCTLLEALELAHSPTPT